MRLGAARDGNSRTKQETCSRPVSVLATRQQKEGKREYSPKLSFSYGLQHI